MRARSTAITNATAQSVATLLPGCVASIGIDAVDIEDFARDLYSEDPTTFLASVFVEAELIECDGASDRLAARFAAKEATLKVLGTGVQGIGMTDVEVRTSNSGRPSIVLSAAAEQVAAGRGIQGLRLSMTREAGLAIAVVVGTSSSQHEQIERDQDE